MVAGGVRRQCATDRNQLALLYNRKLAQETAKLAGSFHGVNLVYIDLYANTPSSPTSYRASKLSVNS